MAQLGLLMVKLHIIKFLTKHGSIAGYTQAEVTIIQLQENQHTGKHLILILLLKASESQ